VRVTTGRETRRATVRNRYRWSSAPATMPHPGAARMTAVLVAIVGTIIALAVMIYAGVVPALVIAIATGATAAACDDAGPIA
jgi:hypothetical protein